MAAIFIVVANLSCSWAQDSDGKEGEGAGNREDSAHPPSELLKVLKSTPASKLDVGLLHMRLRVTSYLLANRPEVLKEDRFRFISVQYIESDDEILVQLSHLSPASLPADLAAECKLDVSLAAAALAPRTEMNREPSNAAEEALLCRSVTSAFFGSESIQELMAREMTGPEENLCHQIRFYARVSSMKDDASVHCYKEFFSEHVEVTHE